MYKLKAYKEVKKRFEEIFSASLFNLELDLNQVLFVMPMEQPGNPVYNLIKLLNQRKEANFIFGLSTPADSNSNGLEQQDYSSIDDFIKSKQKNLQHLIGSDEFSIFMSPSHQSSSMEKTLHMIDTLKVDLVMMAYPFPKLTATHSLEDVVNTLINKVVIEHKTPLFFFQEEMKSDRFLNIDIVFRSATVHQNIIAWLLTFMSHRSTIKTFKTVKLETNDYKTLVSKLKDVDTILKKRESEVKLEMNLKTLEFANYCDSVEKQKLVIFKTTQDDKDLSLVSSLLCEYNSVVILPPQH